MSDFFHHSRILGYRTPQGAAVCGGAVRIEADCYLPGADVTLRLWQEGESEILVPMGRDGSRLSAELTMPLSPCLMWYYFILRLPSGETLYYGAPSGEGALYRHEPPAWQITVYNALFETPRAFCEGVCYQIFPDRFRRSSWEDFRARAQEHVRLGRQIRIHDRWDENACDTAAPGQPYYQPNDFFGGDLNGIRSKLAYLKDLGVSWIYLNPIFESSSNHRYNTGDYLKIDPILGNEAEFRSLCAEARALGIRIILDGVFSHTGSDSRYFNKDGRYDSLGACQSQASPYYQWYNFSRFPDQYECWWDFDSLPNVKELTPSYVDFITGERGVLAHWAGVGATSWRLDVADELPDEFIRLVRKRIKAQDPGAVLIGEVWEDCSNKFGPEGRRDYVDGDELDSAMNYPFAKATAAFLTGRTDAFSYHNALEELREHYPRPFYEACLNLMTSHDDIRLITQMAGAPERSSLSREEQARWRPDPLEKAKAEKRAVVATAIQCAHPGVPCVYYGDEIGMEGMSDPYNREPYPWGGGSRTLLENVRLLLNARQNTPSLKNGLTRMGALGPEVFVILRYRPQDGGCAILTVNRGDAPQTVELVAECLNQGPDAARPVCAAGRYRDALTGETAEYAGRMYITLPPLTARLWIKEG